jgi:hypothetical protein
MKKSEEDFQRYKVAEAKALEWLAQMKATDANPVDVELALLVAVYELHKGSLPAGTITRVIQGHLPTLESYYSGG